MIVRISQTRWVGHAPPQAGPCADWARPRGGGHTQCCQLGHSARSLGWGSQALQKAPGAHSERTSAAKPSIKDLFKLNN